MKYFLPTLLLATALTVPVLNVHAAPAKKVAKKAAKPAAKTTKVATKATKAVPKPAAGMMVAHFELPPPASLGTPPQIKDTTALPFKPRGVVYLPKGAVNLAKSKTVTSSDDAPVIGTLSLVTDGDKNGTEGSWVELAPGTQWVQIDLGKPSTINGILLWHFHAQARVYRDVVIRLADDADFVTNVRTVFNNDRDNSSGLGAGKDREYYEFKDGQWFPIKAQKARYVRLYSRGNTTDPQNQYIEVEVWGSTK